MVKRQRIDTLLLERGLVESQTKAQDLVMAGLVLVSGQVAVKPGTLASREAEIKIVEKSPFVSRGGVKLEYVLEEFHLDVSEKVAADIGASKGGFTDCLLKRGANRVYAVDVGYGQLDYGLRNDPRVAVMERVNARYPLNLPEKLDLAVLDLSFISVEKVIPSVAKMLKDSGYLIVLIKPQFESLKSEVGRRGIVKDSLVHARVLGRFVTWAIKHNFRFKGLVDSPITGASGNREFFILLT